MPGKTRGFRRAFLDRQPLSFPKPVIWFCNGKLPFKVVSNKYTKLQTESGNYHVDFFLPDAPATTEVEGDAYKTLDSKARQLGKC